MTITLNRRIVAIIGAILLAVIALTTWLILSTDDSTPSPSAGVPAAVRTSAEATYLDQVKTTQASLSDDEALRLGRDSCKGWDALRNGQSVDFLTGPGSLEQMAKDGQLTEPQVRGIEDAAVQYLCPANQEYRQSQVR